MTSKTLILGVVLFLTPIASLAMCEKDSHQANACAEGQIWDYEASACVDIVTG